MNYEIKELILLLLWRGNVSPKSILSLGLDYGYTKKDIQLTVQIGFDQGLWHLDREMHLEKGPLPWHKEKSTSDTVKNT